MSLIPILQRLWEYPGQMRPLWKKKGKEFGFETVEGISEAEDGKFWDETGSYLFSVDSFLK